MYHEVDLNHGMGEFLYPGRKSFPINSTCQSMLDLLVCVKSAWGNMRYAKINKTPWLCLLGKTLLYFWKTRMTFLAIPLNWYKPFYSHFMILMIPIKSRQAPLAVALPSWKEMSYGLTVFYWCYGLVISSLTHCKSLLYLPITRHHLSTHCVFPSHLGHPLSQEGYYPSWPDQFQLFVYCSHSKLTSGLIHLRLNSWNGLKVVISKSSMLRVNMVHLLTISMRCKHSGNKPKML